ncbi:MAG: hypothetical protein GY929_09900, partial [Actinomycetia bacterium]|nr:hypothetical protein [Actinomycetes bacterium]
PPAFEHHPQRDQEEQVEHGPGRGFDAAGQHVGELQPAGDGEVELRQDEDLAGALEAEPAGGEAIDQRQESPSGADRRADQQAAADERVCQPATQQPAPGDQGVRPPAADGGLERDIG